jgi:hypothetical protein
LQNRNVFVEKLLLQIDGVRRDDGLFLLPERKQDRRNKIRQGFADAGARFDD